jgi:feruloyl esterase
MKKLTFLILLIAILSPGFKTHSQTIANNLPCIACEDLLKLDIPDVRITEAAINADQKYCNLKGIIGSEIGFELKLPERWNGRFVMGGGGGFAGSLLNWAEFSLDEGYATAGTDTGHEGSWLSGLWALNNIERQINFAFLGVHRTAVTSKVIVEKYYGQKPEYSYFYGCSRGGSQGLIEAWRYPGDFDGIFSEGPGRRWPAFALELLDNYRLHFPENDSSPEGILKKQKVDLLAKIIYEKYDALDGLKDNIISDPSQYVLDYNLLPVCPDGKESPNCFTSQQIRLIKSIYEGVKSGDSIIYPGLPIGSEKGWFQYLLRRDSSVMTEGVKTPFSSLGVGVFRYFVFNDPEWDFYKYDFSDFPEDSKFASSFLDITDPDLSAFSERGGKILMCQGWADWAVSPFNTTEFYNTIKNKDKNASNYMMLYMVDGGGHCNLFDQGPAKANWLEHLRKWVEEGKQPHEILVSKLSGKDTIMTRPVYPYPSKTIFKGSGDPDNKNSFREESKVK